MGSEWAGEWAGAWGCPRAHARDADSAGPCTRRWMSRDHVPLEHRYVLKHVRHGIVWHIQLTSPHHGIHDIVWHRRHGRCLVNRCRCPVAAALERQRGAPAPALRMPCACAAEALSTPGEPFCPVIPRRHARPAPPGRPAAAAPCLAGANLPDPPRPRRPRWCLPPRPNEIPPPRLP